jgi:hypothetical protein
MRTSWLIPILLACAATARATDVCVADCSPSTGTACNALPFSQSFTSGECRYQAMFTQAQMGPAGRITDLSFTSCSTGTFAANVLEITMSHLNAPFSTSFAANLPLPQVVRLAVPITWSLTMNQWARIRLDCPFEYNGVDSVVVEVRFQGGTNGGGFQGSIYRSGVAPRIYVWGAGSYAAATGALDIAAFKIRFTKADVTVTGGTPSPGGTVNLLFDASSDAGLSYYGGSSLGSGPVAFGCWPLDLEVDTLLILSASGSLPSTFVNYQGILSATGQATPSVNLPPTPGLAGLAIRTAFVTLDGQGMKTISAAGSFTIQ